MLKKTEEFFLNEDERQGDFSSEIKMILFYENKKKHGFKDFNGFLRKRFLTEK